ncbi:ClpXP protease specificity-enhancing factor SspB [Polyangium aurulentum]|uniref:ClpXP protease specificity-enhancing factor SspB n=1 Tax=Polyangium aurulentum TaxID=2567896 RepID=UPI00146BE620|nr:ClpXP protease specificity-enhancing factor SspB [Polyangium aurulentum]UQA62843.1 hypothetical protein E8A73_021275 [Polyangium aurulentum]
MLLALAGCGGNAAPAPEPPRAEPPVVAAPVKAADARAAEGEALEDCMPIPRDPPEAPPKLEVAQAIASEGLLYIHLDPRAPGVVVPEKHAKKPRLVLAVGEGLPLPIPDLKIDASGVSGTLSFNHAPFFSTVPWSAVYALISPDGRGMVWYEDVPPELRCPPGVEPPAN